MKRTKVVSRRLRECGLAALALTVGWTVLALGPALADQAEAEECLRNRIWEGYNERWSVRTATGATLGEGESRVYVVTLYAGTEYRMLACADRDAGDVDLVLHDEGGQVLVEDDSVDRQPQLGYTPSATGTYYVAVHLREVKTAGSRFGLGMAVTYR